MTRLLVVAAMLGSTTVLATGERIALVPTTSPFKETLCVSMNCGGSGRPEATVASRPVRNGLEITVTMASGQKRLSRILPLKADGTVSSTELVRATSLVLRAIEEGPVAAERSEPRRKVSKMIIRSGKKARVRMLAHR
jgi:hypothetical protein